MSQRAPNPPSPEEQRDHQRKTAMDNAVIQEGAAQGPIPDIATSDVWEILGGPDIEMDGEDIDDEIEQLLATELSDKFVFSQLRSFDELDEKEWLIENQFERILWEFQDHDNSLSEEDLDIMYGEGDGDVKPAIPERLERRIRSGADVKKRMLSLAVHAEGLRSLSDITIDNRQTDDSTPDGLLGGVRGALWG